MMASEHAVFLLREGENDTIFEVFLFRGLRQL
jgi:hypothetical protein